MAAHTIETETGQILPTHKYKFFREWFKEEELNNFHLDQLLYIASFIYLFTRIPIRVGRFWTCLYETKAGTCIWFSNLPLDDLKLV